jgi:amidase
VPRDAHVAGLLRAAGVVLLGKTSLSHWANLRSSNSSNGCSAVFGQVTGAYHPNMDPSGSSSGSGASSSIGPALVALVALRTETHGSILSLSSTNNLVGIKPTVGLASRPLVIPISEHQDTVGPMARTVADAAYVLSAIAGKAENDNYTPAQPWDTPPDCTRSLNFSSLRGARIGTPSNAFTINTDSRPVPDAFDAAVQVIKNAGAIIVDNANYSAWDEYIADAIADFGNSSIVLSADFVSDLSNYLAQFTSNPNNVKPLADVSNFTQKSPLEAYPQRDTAVWDQALSLGFNNSDFRFWQAYQFTSYFGGECGVLRALKANNLDALSLPTDSSPGIPA